MKSWHNKLLTLVLAAGLLTTAAPTMAGAAAQPLVVKVNDHKVEYRTGGAPTVQKQVTLVPLRSTLKAMGIQLASVTKNSITVVVEGQSHTIKSKLTQIKGVTYVPIRTFGELPGYTVSWNAKSRTIQLVSVPSAPAADETASSPADSTPAPAAPTDSNTTNAELPAVSTPAPTTAPATTNTTTAPAPVQTGARGFMWEVKSNGNTVYLVGSIHVADDSFYPLRQEYEQAFAEADSLSVEVDITKDTSEDFQKHVLDTGMYHDGSTLRNHISTYTYEKLGRILEANDMKSGALDRFKPWVAEMIVSSFAPDDSGYDADLGIDLHFIKKAEDKDIPVIGLETEESQLRMLNNFSDELQEKLLYSTLASFDDNKQNQPADDHEKELGEMWKTGDEKALMEVTNSSMVEPEYHKAILVDRNINMANKIDTYLKSNNNQQYFVVVGAAHYLGNDGIIKLLENKGYTVTRK
ncbi:TraB/GumN family protein [Paenibacillus bovis]|uniref:Polysaccharide biosynthesis protein GumN n=1 Tax=Paenibacillus bovis TaxID=1616788 RepID=A0A172ZD81_9BACL|nr:TraB/GumN family protein [Paenibacillus bovis]ANF95473.1 polysaccharide biosynthesis protein GumN [Paenibacillus bovis]